MFVSDFRQALLSALITDLPASVSYRHCATNSDGATHLIMGFRGDRAYRIAVAFNEIDAQRLKKMSLQINKQLQRYQSIGVIPLKAKTNERPRRDVAT